MRQFALNLVLWSGILAAEEFNALTGNEILHALTDRKLDCGGGVWQSFDDTVLTQNFSTRPGAGWWVVRGDQYWSHWPPPSLWACYETRQRDKTIRFVDRAGGKTDGTFAE